jgi:hypothetical protein
MILFKLTKKSLNIKINVVFRYNYLMKFKIYIKY